MGMIAAANEGRSKAQALVGGLRFASGMTVGFILVFGTFGLVFCSLCIGNISISTNSHNRCWVSDCRTRFLVVTWAKDWKWCWPNSRLGTG